MQDKQELIPQIKPDSAKLEDVLSETSSTTPDKGGSILVPDGLNDQAKVETVKSDEPNPNPKQIFKNKKVAIGLIVGLVILVLAVAVPSLMLYSSIKKFEIQAKVLVSAAKSQDIAKIETEIANTKTSLTNVRNSFKLASWMKIIPLLGSYVTDAGHALAAGSYSLDAAQIAVKATGPYLNLLGFGKGSAAAIDGTKTTQERINFFVGAIPGLLPKVDEISGLVAKAKVELDTINPDKYPVKVGTTKVRENLKLGLSVFDEASTFLSKGKPLLQASPYLLGIDSPRTFLVLFQNDKELRPTGGFLTAYSIMKVDKGKFEPVISSDIYNLDAQYTPSFAAPDPIVKYIKGPYILSTNLRLRDMNWSPDFGVSMQSFLTEAKKVGVENIDGVIAVDTQVLVNLLNVIGQIGVSGFGNFSTKIEPACNCAQVIYELESFADVEGPIIWDPVSGKIIYRPPNSDNRKKIIGPLMNSILSNAMGQPKEKLPALFEAGFRSLTEKHVLFYINNQDVQKAVQSFGIGGNIEDYSADYLHINDANLGGRKSNLYVKQEVEQDIIVARDGSVEKTLTITYKNPEKQDGWLNSVLPDWLRIYVPKGSTLISFDGVENKQTPYEEFGKTVFAGFYQLRPEGVAKITIKYKLPFKVSGTYKILIQKQPGLDAPLYTTNIGRTTDEEVLTTDREFRYAL